MLGMVACSGCLSYHAAHVPNIGTVCPWHSQNHFWCSIDHRLNEDRVLLADHGRAEIAKNGAADVFGDFEFLGHVNCSPVRVHLFSRNGALKLILFEVSKDGIVFDAEHDIIGLDVW